MVHVYDVNQHALSVGMTHNYMTNPNVSSYDASIQSQHELALYSQPIRIEIHHSEQNV